MAIVTVHGMSCEHCRNAVTEAVKKIPGLTDVTVDLAAGSVSWQGDESPAAHQAVKAAVIAVGFEII